MKLLTENERQTPCVETQEHPPTLVLETLENGVWVFDWYLHFSHVVFTPDGEKSQLTIFFDTHSITLEGESLQSLVPALARKGVAKIREYPEKYGIFPEGRGVSIHKVAIEERSRA